VSQFTILSHNTFWFQGYPFRKDNPDKPDREILNRICTIYKDIKPDIICLQEIQNLETFQIVSDKLEMPGCYCPGIELPQYGGSVFWQPDGGRLIFDSNSSSFRTQRMWQIVEFGDSNNLFKICNIHLPSKRQLGPERAEEQRLTELKDSIQSVKTELDIIAGDFNEQPNGPLSKYLESQDYLDTAIISLSTEAVTTIGGSRSDNIWINKKIEDKFLKFNFVHKKDFAHHNDGKEFLSDHLPIWITLEIR